MNFLAHLILSNNDAEIMIGNFIGDSVKGKAYQKYSPKIQQGILLHRKIDELTDNHPVTKELAQLFRKGYRKHAGIVVDIIYDHFLSKNWSLFSEQQLDDFIKYCHKVLLKNILLMPSRIQSFLPVLIAKRRLKSYSEIEGIKIVLEKMSQYTSLPDATDFAIQTLKRNYLSINDSFLVFFEELKPQIPIELNTISKQLRTVDNKAA